ncbi:hypothetical protein BMS3Bbin03_02901 [bacterium BMS3Bbin03]|nr:hypothetical protein BMS3Bbin03_02901 [bacterium BMS3Bbin03]
MDTQGKTGDYGKHYAFAEKEKTLQAVRSPGQFIQHFFAS